MASIFFKPNGNPEKMSTRYNDQGDTFHHVEGGNNGKKVQQAQGKPGNGRIHTTVISSTNRQPTREDRAQQERQALEEAATRGSYVLNRNCKTGARVESYKIHDGYVEYKFNGPHGFKHGRAGQTEVPDDRRARWLT